MKVIKRHSALLIASLVFLVAVVLLGVPGWKQRGRRSYVNYVSAPLTAQAAEVNPWTLAVEKVKEDRGEPTGKQAKVDIPQQVRHYSDTRRFLAIQTAEWREHALRTPQDFVDLAAMIASREMVALKPVSENYILFGVGGNADKDPFTRYLNGKSINLYNEAGLKQAYARIADSCAKFEKEIAGLKQQLGSVNKRERSKRAKLQAEIAATEKVFKAERTNKELLDRYYDNTERRAQLFSDYEVLKSLAPALMVGLPRGFDIEDARARQQMKVRMLSSLRPEALKVLEEVALSYREKFHRPLPITSLVRPDEYQHALSKVNPNATRIETPPHSTGLAFDILYRYMTAEEQSHVMAHLARLKDDGRIEVLRENRDHYHVFAFVDGEKPNEMLISASLGKTVAAKAVKKTHHAVANNAKKKIKQQTGASKRQRVKSKRRS